MIALTAALLTAAPAPALASKASAWKRVLRTHRAAHATALITVRPGHVGPRTVSVHLAAPSANTASVTFPDPLYGATAWRWNGRRWRRIDSARVRPAMVQELAPGQRVRVRLPLERRARRIRVLVPVTADRAGAWADVRR